MARTNFIVDDPMTRNAIHVLSRAPLETILVRTNDVRGEIEIDPDDVTDRPRVTFEVPIDALASGVPLMNDVMRSDRWLDAAKSPVIRFALGRVLSPETRRRWPTASRSCSPPRGRWSCAGPPDRWPSAPR